MSSKAFDFVSELENLDLDTAAAVEDDDSDGVESVTGLAARESPHSTDTGTTLFGSPRSQLSGGVSVGGGKDKVKLFFVDNSNNYCCGAIGPSGTNRACIRAASACTTAKHQGNKNKLTLKDNTIYITAGRSKNAVLVEPGVHRSMCSDDVWEYLTTAEQTVEVWRPELEAVIERHSRIQTNILKVSTSGLDEDTDWAEDPMTPGSGQVQAAAEELASPSGADLSSAMESIQKADEEREEDAIEALGETFEEVQDIPYQDEDKLLPDEDKAVGVILSEWRSVVANFKHVAEQIKLIKEGQRTHKEGVIDGFNALNDKLKQIDTKSHIISSKVGDDPLLSDGGSKTVWQAIGELAEEIAVVMATGSSIEKEWDGKHEEMGKKLEELTESMDVFKQSFISTVKKIYAELKSTNTDVAKLAKSVRQAEKNGGLGGSPSDKTLNALTTQVRHLRNRIDSLEQSAHINQALANAVGGTPTSTIKTVSFSPLDNLRARASPTPPDLDDLEELKTVCDKMNTEVEYLKRKLEEVEQMSARDQGKPYRIGMYMYSSPADLEPLFDFNTASTKFDIGWFWELFSALENMVSKNQTGKGHADEKHSADRTGTTVNANDMMARMDHELPHVFFSVKKDSEPSKERELLACPTYEKWLGDGRNSFKTWVDEKLAEFIEQIYEVLPKDGSRAAIVAELLCNNLMRQWTHISKFVDTVHTKLVIVSGFSEKATWKLIGRYLGAIFTDMRKYRSAVARLDTTHRANQVRILWAIIQCHRVVDEYCDVKFESHPSIVAEIGVFMMTERVDPSRIASLENKVGDLLNSVKELQKDNKRLHSEIESVKASAKTDRNNWKNELAQVAKRIKE